MNVIWTAGTAALVLDLARQGKGVCICVGHEGVLGSEGTAPGCKIWAADRLQCLVTLIEGNVPDAK